MSGKIKARNITSQVTGPTFDHNSPLKFPNKGKEHGKTKSGSTILPHAPGPTWLIDKPGVPSMHPSEYGKHKEMTSKAASNFNPMNASVNKVCDRTASAKSGESTPSYPLKKSYEK